MLTFVWGMCMRCIRSIYYSWIFEVCQNKTSKNLSYKAYTQCILVVLRFFFKDARVLGDNLNNIVKMAYHPKLYTNLMQSSLKS